MTNGDRWPYALTTKSRWGRRRPYILMGGNLMGILLAVTPELQASVLKTTGIVVSLVGLVVILSTIWVFVATKERRRGEVQKETPWAAVWGCLTNKHFLLVASVFIIVLGWIIKSSGGLTGILAGVVLVWVSINTDSPENQTAESIQRLRTSYAFMQSGLLSLAILVISRYKLTRERIGEMQAEISARS